MKNSNGFSLPFDYKMHFDFDMLYDYYYRWELSLVMELLQFDGLPETIESTFMKWCLFVTGKVTFFRDDGGRLLALNGVPAAEPDVYYIPKDVIVDNPVLTKSYTLKRDENCVVVYCTETDKYVYYGQDGYGGLYSLLAKTATMLADNDVSINVAQKNTRLHNIVSADDENTKNSIDMVFKKMYDGQPYSVVQSNFIGTLQSVPLLASTSNSYIVQLVELHQYILAHFYEALGIQTHDNMKKERLITAELDDNPSLLQMNINNILKSVTEGIEKVNEMFGTSITVSLNPLLKATQEAVSETNQELPTEETQEATSETNQEPATEEIQEAEVETNQESPKEENSTQEINITVEDDAKATIIITERGGDELDISDSTADETSLD